VKYLKVVRHALYSFTKTVINDVALLELCEPAQYNDFVGAACLPRPNERLEDGEEVIAVGWGSSVAGGPPVGYLKEARVYQVEFTYCKCVACLLCCSLHISKPS